MRTAQKYGVFREKDGITDRALFVIDKNGKVRWSKVYDIPEHPPEPGALHAIRMLK